MTNRSSLTANINQRYKTVAVITGSSETEPPLNSESRSEGTKFDDFICDRWQTLTRSTDVHTLNKKIGIGKQEVLESNLFLMISEDTNWNTLISCVMFACFV